MVKNGQKSFSDLFRAFFPLFLGGFLGGLFFRIFPRDVRGGQKYAHFLAFSGVFLGSGRERGNRGKKSQKLRFFGGKKNNSHFLQKNVIFIIFFRRWTQILSPGFV